MIGAQAAITLLIEPCANPRFTRSSAPDARAETAPQPVFMRVLNTWGARKRYSMGRDLQERSCDVDENKGPVRENEPKTKPERTANEPRMKSKKTASNPSARRSNSGLGAEQWLQTASARAVRLSRRQIVVPAKNPCISLGRFG
jgi:hypothetical protein